MDMTIQTIDLVECLSNAVDLISPKINDHHQKVIIISYYLGKAYGLSPSQLEDLLIAASIHDIGALTAKEHLDLLDFDEVEGDHSKYGASLLKAFKPFAHIAPIIKYHHSAWKDRNIAVTDGEEISILSRIIYLADRISVLIQPDFKLNQVEDISKLVYEKSGTSFHPDLVDAYREIAKKECFWLDIKEAAVHSTLKQILTHNLNLTASDLLELGTLLSQIIDFRSKFTAAHSSGVSAVACSLAETMGLSDHECLLMNLAGDLHDIGKLVVPEAILEKNGRLSSDEFDVMRSHAYYTDRLLSGISAFDSIRIWGALHHEKLNGQGYPFGLKEHQIPLGSRIMAVADIYTAVAEDRPYRKGMDRKDTMEVLNNLVKDGSIDKNVVGALMGDYSLIESNRIEAQNEALQKYIEFYLK